MNGEGKSPFGWKVSGVAAPGRDDAPLVKALVDARYDWPPAEVHHGVASFEIKVWADDPSSAYVTVWGPDSGAVRDTFDRIAAAVCVGAMADHFPTEAPS